MGGLTAPFDEIVMHLPPMDNLYLETSNAVHTLSREQFISLLRAHGPERILFGTDWPWFGHKTQLALINDLLDSAGFAIEDKAKVFSGNINRLLNL